VTQNEVLVRTFNEQMSLKKQPPTTQVGFSMGVAPAKVTPVVTLRRLMGTSEKEAQV